MTKTVTKTVTKTGTKTKGKKRYKRAGKKTTLMLSKGVFPTECKTTLRTVVFQNVYTGGASYFKVLTYKANSFWYTGPRENWTGAYSQNVPTGLYNLLSSDAFSGAVAPYSRAYIDKATMEVEYVPTGTSNPATVIAIVPTLTAELSGITVSNLAEQPYAKYYLLPPILNTKGVKISNTITMEQITGMNANIARNAQYEYTSSVQDPVKLVYWHILLLCPDTTSTIAGSLIMKHTQHATFYNNNVLNSGVPS